MRVFQAVVTFLWITVSAGYSWSSPEKDCIRACIVQLKPHNVIFATDREAYRSVTLDLAFVLHQWIDEKELKDFGYGKKTVPAPTLIVVQSKLAEKCIKEITKEKSQQVFAFDVTPLHNSYIWLVIQTKNDPELDLKSFQIAFNTEFYYLKPLNASNFEIIEKYDFSNRHAIFQYGTWSPGYGLNVSKLDFYARRMNVNGALFKISKAINNFCEPIICMQREIWKGISAMMNITSKETFSDPDVLTASSVSTLTGIEFHAHVNALPPRPTVGPIYTMRVYMHVKAVGKETAGWRQFLKPFHYTMWIAVAALIAIATATSVCINVYLDKRLLPEHFFHPLAIFTNQGANCMNTSLSFRLVSVATTITAMVVLPIYSAAVLSAIMIKNEKLPFVNLEGLTQQEGYKIAGVYDKFSVHYMQMETKYQNIVDNFFAAEMPGSVEAGLELLCNDDKFVLLGYNDFMLQDKNLKCRMLKIPHHIFSSPLSFRLRSDSPFTKVFNRNFIRFYSSGILKKLAKEAEGAAAADDYVEQTAAVELSNVMLPVYVVATGACISFILLVSEIIFFYLIKRKISSL